MKERLIVTEKSLIESTKHIAKEYDKEDVAEHTIEQVPETWEELKELCINLKRDYDITYVSSTIWVHGLSFNETGIIGDSHHSFIVEDRTPAQMWQIIKNLIGE